MTPSLAHALFPSGDYLLVLLCSLMFGAVYSLAFLIGVIMDVYARLRFNNAPTNEPRCPGCRYIIKGITSKTCPECGHGLTSGLLGPEPPRIHAWPWFALACAVVSLFVPIWIYSYDRLVGVIALGALPLGSFAWAAFQTWKHRDSIRAD